MFTYKSEDLPADLWYDRRIMIPQVLAQAYRTELIRLELLEQAIAGTTKTSIHGGLTREETTEHFAYRFGNSVTRIEYVILDPNRKLNPIPLDVAVTFSSHHVAFLDIPCGTGAGAASILCSLHALRSAGLVPKLPLTVGITAADLSEPALEIYDSMMKRLTGPLAEAGILIEWRTHRWDASLPHEMSQLCDAWFNQLPEAAEHFVLVSSMSGVGRTQFGEFERSFQHLVERLSNRMSTILWIEPESQSTRRFLKKVGDFFKKAISWLKPEDGKSSESVFDSFAWWDAVRGQEVTSTVAVQRYLRNAGEAT